MDIDIISLRPQDIPVVLKIEEGAFPIPLNKADIEKGILDALSFVAREGVKAIGYILAEKVLDEAHIIRIAVKEGNRGAGIGRQLMEKLFNEGKLKSINKYYLEVRASNAAAREFYNKAGFTEVFTRKKYYADNDEDAVFMEKIGE